MDKRLGFLEQDDVALSCVFYLDVTEAMLLREKRKGWADRYRKARAARRGIIAGLHLLVLKMSMLDFPQLPATSYMAYTVIQLSFIECRQ